MPRMIVPTSAPGTVDNWGFSGAASSWEAVRYNSGDDSYIFSEAVAEVSDFHCGAGSAPATGRIMGVTLHYRVRAIVPGVNQVDFIITQNTVQHTVGATVNIVGLAWQEGAIRVREDWTSLTRFTLADVGALGAGVSTVALPIGGRIEISKLWLEVEYVVGPEFYDPYDGVLPDAIVGPLNWITVGAQPATITGNNYLRLDDTSVADLRAYQHTLLTTDRMREDYVTEYELRVTMTNPSAVPSVPLFGMFSWVDNIKSLILVAAKFSGVYHVGLISVGPDPSNPANYVALEPMDYIGKDTHFRIRVDRDQTPGSLGQVEVYVDYAATPLLRASYWNALDAAASPTVATSFGTFVTAEIRTDIDYFSWRTFKKNGDLFRAWTSWDFSTNNIDVDDTDPDIVRKVLITPPGIAAGQSRYACVLEVNDPPAVCDICQFESVPDPSPDKYKIDIDYKMDIVAVDGELVVQRSSDLWYWDETGGAWSSTFQSVTLANQTSRARVAMMTGIMLTSVTDDVLLLRISRKTNTLPAYKILIYKVGLYKE